MSNATQEGRVISARGFARRIVMTMGTLQWQSFSEELREHVNSPIQEPMRLVINGEVLELEPDNTGKAEFVFEAPSGTYLLKTDNEGADNAELEVVVP